MQDWQSLGQVMQRLPCSKETLGHFVTHSPLNNSIEDFLHSRQLPGLLLEHLEQASSQG
jgi:hypothetical protein